jgi:hypothetical protein
MPKPSRIAQDEASAALKVAGRRDTSLAMFYTTYLGMGKTNLR